MDDRRTDRVRGTVHSVHPRPRSLLVFFGLAFAISWLVWVPAALASHRLIAFPMDPTLSGLLGVFGPFLAALATTALFEGHTGFGALFKRLGIWRVGLQWYAFVLLWPSVHSLVTTAVHVMKGGVPPDFTRPPFVQLYPLPPEAVALGLWTWLPFVFLQQTLLGSSLYEEVGWRGYALPRLQGSWSAFPASLILGLLWGVWHLPLALTQGHPLAATFFGWTLLDTMAAAVLFTWVFNNTRGSLFLAVLFHTSIAVTGLFLSSTPAHPVVGSAVTWGVALLVTSMAKTGRLAPSPME